MGRKHLEGAKKILSRIFSLYSASISRHADDVIIRGALSRQVQVLKQFRDMKTYIHSLCALFSSRQLQNSILGEEGSPGTDVNNHFCSAFFPAFSPRKRNKQNIKYCIHIPFPSAPPKKRENLATSFINSAPNLNIQQQAIRAHLLGLIWRIWRPPDYNRFIMTNGFRLSYQLQ